MLQTDVLGEKPVTTKKTLNLIPSGWAVTRCVTSILNFLGVDKSLNTHQDSNGQSRCFHWTPVVFQLGPLGLGGGDRMRGR